MAKIAEAVERALAERASRGEPGRAAARPVARGDGWSVRDVVCTSGPGDRTFEEQHGPLSVSIVLAGTFQYRSGSGCELMTPGSLLLGNSGLPFECAHEHGAGDRCLSFQYAPEHFERLVETKAFFRSVRIPPIRSMSAITARAAAVLMGRASLSWEELAIELAGRTIDTLNGTPTSSRPVPSRAVERVTRAVRTMEQHSDGPLDIATLTGQAGLSPFHFLRTFERITGVTPHQYLLRTRLRDAAIRLAEPAKVLDVAFDCGFGDVSNFNRSFRAEFGLSPRAYRKALQRPR